MTDLTGEIFGAALDALLTPSETRTKQRLAPYITTALERIDALVERGELITDAELEDALSELNDAARSVLGEELESLQPALLSLAARCGDVGPATPLPGPVILDQAEMDGTTITTWLERHSPSQWMRGLMDAVRQGIDDGWTRHRAATSTTLERLTATLVETSTWSAANQRLTTAWTATEHRWITREDEKVCSICAPLDGTIFSGASNGPPAHPRCRCVALPR